LSSHLARLRPTLPAWKGSRHVSIPRTWRPTSR
jgi:hypothetical protein